ncbi:MAG: S9 family peptidase [Gemmatimonadetes bacterium]|nr:S9 family peptidase [Gemmatimonadota bacterium]
MKTTTRRALIAALSAGTLAASADAQRRPMTFLDVQHLKQAGGVALSPDGRWALYTLSTPDWKEARRSTDVWLVSTSEGVRSARQLTFTADKNETAPAWTPDGRFFVFSSNREAQGPNGGNQLFLMRPDGGEARRITDDRDGVGRFEISADGAWLVYAAGKANEQQLKARPLAALLAGDSAAAVEVTNHPAPITGWQLSRDGKRVFFTAADSLDKAEKARIEKKFTVAIRNYDVPLEHLWTVPLETRQPRRLTGGTEYGVASFSLSDDAAWVGFRGAPNDRYKRTVTEAGNHTDLYLVEVATGRIERLTTNAEIGESNLSFSPDGAWIAFAASNDFVYSRDQKIYLRATKAADGPWRKLGAGYDGGLGIGWWSRDARTIYFNEGVRVTNQVLALDIASDLVKPVVAESASVFATRDDTGPILITYADPSTPPSIFLARTEADLANRTAWVRLTDPNPQVAGFALGQASEYTWRSRDGKTVGGVLVKPAGYQPGRRYPLIVQIHGGPAGADVLGFNGGYGSQIYAGAGYAVLLPNYRGSTNYGERHRVETAGIGKYFDRGFDDIMTGVDQLVADGVAHPDSLGAMGWSAGGHYSNWILTHTDRFKAISSGAGTVNWVSMYAQSDVQRNRQWYMGGDLPYDNHEAYWRVSPLKYIKNAKTPTMIHVVDGDPRVPRPQSEELHMALKKLGVPTELFVYPGNTHGITEPRNQLTKAMVEFNWFEKWIRGKPAWLNWQEMLVTLPDSAPARPRLTP